MTLASEWTKLVTLRSTYAILGLSILLSVAVTSLLAIIVGATWSEWSTAEREEFHPLLISTGIDAAGVGDLAAARGLRLHELTPQRARLEEAFFELTEGSVEYQAAATEEGR